MMEFDLLYDNEVLYLRQIQLFYLDTYKNLLFRIQ